jgi:hypothetical protein
MGDGVLFVRLNYYLAERKGAHVALDLIIGVSSAIGFTSRVFPRYLRSHRKV